MEKIGLEGMVSKCCASIYRSGPSKDRGKIKAYSTGEFAVIGYGRKCGAAPSLLLAEDTDASMRHVGRAIPALAQRDALAGPPVAAHEPLGNTDRPPAARLLLRFT